MNQKLQVSLQNVDVSTPRAAVNNLVAPMLIMLLEGGIDNVAGKSNANSMGFTVHGFRIEAFRLNEDIGFRGDPGDTVRKMSLEEGVELLQQIGQCDKRAALSLLSRSSEADPVYANGLSNGPKMWLLLGT